MILKDPYQFRTSKLLDSRDTINAINRYITIEYDYIKSIEKVKLRAFTNDSITLNPVILYGISSSEEEVREFIHPLINIENNWIALDLRRFVKKEGTSYEIRNKSEYNLALHKFILTGMWATDKQSQLYALKLAQSVFAMWLSDNISRKFGLDPGAQMQLNVLAIIYYSKLFTDYWSEDDYAKLKVKFKDDVLVSTIIGEIYDRIDERLENINDFCRNAYSVTDNLRLKGLDYIVLMNILSTSWMGQSSKDMVYLSLEHPPTWISLVYTALTERSYKKSVISSATDKCNKKGRGEEFITSLVNMTNDYKADSYV